MSVRTVFSAMTLICVFGLWTLAFGEARTFNYMPNEEGTNLPLRCLCGSGDPIPYDTDVYLLWDLNANGPDSTDPIVSDWVIGGSDLPLDPGYFNLAGNYVGVPTNSDATEFYVRTGGAACCWHTRNFSLTDNESISFVYSDWTCEAQNCQTNPTAMQIIYRGPLLRYPCGGTTQVPAGAPVRLYRDVHSNGPDLEDELIARVNLESEDGYFHRFSSPMIFLRPEDPDSLFYMEIDTLGCCWQTAEHTIVPGRPLYLWRTDTTVHCVNEACPRPLAVADPQTAIPQQTGLTNVYPNPFNPETRIEFELTVPGTVNVVLFNLQGQKVRTLTQEAYSAGTHFLVWDGRNDSGVPLGSGLYFCRMTSGQFSDVHSLLLMK